MWCLHLHDTILSMCCYFLKDGDNKVFATLANGTVCIIEVKYEDMYIYIFLDQFSCAYLPRLTMETKNAKVTLDLKSI